MQSCAILHFEQWLGTFPIDTPSLIPLRSDCFHETLDLRLALGNRRCCQFSQPGGSLLEGTQVCLGFLSLMSRQYYAGRFKNYESAAFVILQIRISMFGWLHCGDSKFHDGKCCILIRYAVCAISGIWRKALVK